jgi:hypothetical protein
MAEEQSNRDTGDEAESGMPRWVYGLAAVTLLIVVAVVAMHLAGGGGPGAHVR